jgi:glycerol-3-phosphate acyltransferase PlsY
MMPIAASSFPSTTRRWIIAITVALYLYFLLPATANMFFKLYHMTHINPIYWGYSGFKAAGYFLGAYEHRMLVCVLVAAVIILIPVAIEKLRRARG